MGTPVPSKAVERAVVNCIDPNKIEIRQMTPEERAHYDNLSKPKKKAVFILPEDESRYINHEMESEEMYNKPSKEKLEEMCKQYPSKFRASYGISKELGVSHATIDNWIKAYDIKDVWKKPEETMQDADQEDSSGTPEDDTREFDVMILELEPGRFMEYNGNAAGLIQDESTQDQDTDELVLENKIYRFGPYSADIQYMMKQVVICDSETLIELVIPFNMVGRLAGNLQKISTELKEREGM